MKHSSTSALPVLAVLALALLPVSGCGADTGASARPRGEGNAPPNSEDPPPVVVNQRASIELALQQDPLAQRVVSVLETHCARCHGGEEAQGGLGDVTDLLRQIERGTIVAGAAAQSRLLSSMLDGSMPLPDPRRPGWPGPTPGELALVAQFIDQLPTAPAAECSATAFQSTDAVYAALLADVLRVPASERRFQRYAGLTYASNAGECGTALERQRSALFKLLNSVSAAPEVHVPEAVDPSRLLYRIDLRDYGWNRGIDPEDDGTPDFVDGWLAVVASAGPYALELQGADAEELQRESGSSTPFLPAHALIHAAAGEAYYALIDMPAAQDKALEKLGVNPYDAETPGVLHAGFLLDGGDLLVQRMEQQRNPGRFYWMISTLHNVSESIFSEPFDYGGAEEALFQLPNGMLAFHRDEATANFGPGGAPDSLWHADAANLASCHACHQSGILPVSDQVRQFVEQNRIEFDNETFELVAQRYPLPAELDALIEADSALYRSASERAGVVSSGPEPLSYTYRQFELEALSLPRVAAELGVTAEELRNYLPQLDPRLQGLAEADGTIERSLLGEVYLDSLCVVLAVAENQPVSCP
ncbi:MAG TPA: hypothetical protein VJU61_02910 [Polyangiaceae bacterium]|nr:hypothetical protein [Polyangiaceae bacterium]